jgi:hypothetical protein
MGLNLGSTRFAASSQDFQASIYREVELNAGEPLMYLLNYM